MQGRTSARGRGRTRFPGCAAASRAFGLVLASFMITTVAVLVVASLVLL